MYKQSIGIVGGFGGYATLNFFERLLSAFNTGRERDYPRVLIDCDFTMPSRTRGLLYGEEIDTITQMMAKSVKNLLHGEVDYIILPCGTAHWYLDGVYELVPEARGRVVDIINTTGAKLQREGVGSCFAIAAEGTLKQKLYNKKLKPYGIAVSSPDEPDWPKIRYFIEAVKQNTQNREVRKEFVDFIMERKPETEDSVRVILGCTELPCLIDDQSKGLITFEDPLENVLIWLKENLR